MAAMLEEVREGRVNFPPDQGEVLAGSRVIPTSPSEFEESQERVGTSVRDGPPSFRTPIPPGAIDVNDLHPRSGLSGPDAIAIGYIKTAINMLEGAANESQEMAPLVDQIKQAIASIFQGGPQGPPVPANIGAAQREVSLPPDQGQTLLG